MIDDISYLFLIQGKKPALYRDFNWGDFIPSSGSQTSLCQNHLHSLIQEISGSLRPLEFDSLGLGWVLEIGIFNKCPCAAAVNWGTTL